VRHLFYSTILLVTIFACNSETSEQVQKVELSVQQVKDCTPGRDTLNFVTAFTKDTVNTSTDRFYSIVSFITNKGLFKPNSNQNGKLKVEKETTKTLVVFYDTCDMKRWITKNFIMKNMQVTTLRFTGTKKDRYSGFTPGLHFEEWKFADNSVRDSALRIVQTAYTYPNNIVMYGKRYSQFMLDDKRIFLLQTGAKFAEPYAIEYKKLIEQFISANYKNR